MGENLRKLRRWLAREPDYFRDPYVIPSAEGPNCFPRLNPPCICVNNDGDNARCLVHGRGSRG